MLCTFIIIFYKKGLLTRNNSPGLPSKIVPEKTLWINLNCYFYITKTGL